MDEIKKEMNKLTLSKLISIEPTDRDSEDHEIWKQTIREHLDIN